MTPSATPNVLDITGLAALKRQAKASDPQGIKAAAQQFEALLIQQMLKAMRDATPQDGLFDSDQTRMYQSLLDQQLAQVMATRGGGTGLAAMIEKQLSRQSSAPQSYPDGLPLEPMQRSLPIPASRAFPLPGTSSQAVPANATPSPSKATSNSGAGSAEFIREIRPHAAKAAANLGVPTDFVVAQAALESAWGRAVPRQADGRSSYNLFGIKAGAAWTGPVVEATTSEYSNGTLQKRVEKFRAYGSYAEAFQDYANLLSANPRYAMVTGTTSATEFARGLQRAGYATDPQYAAKLERVIGTTARRTPPMA